jgi:ribonucleoside-diphosphate reductase beta chain
MFKPIFGPCDSYQLEPFAYEWAWKMSREQEENNWAPEEIPVSFDVADYNDAQLEPHYKHIFEAVMAQLTTFDIERGDDAAETFLQIVQPAELKHFLKRLVWDEALHTRSYRYCIENLGVPVSGPNNIYDRWNQVPVMKARVEMAQEISDGLMNAWFTHQGTQQDKFQIPVGFESIFFRAAFFWFMIFEGVWFWMNLCGPVQAMKRVKRFTNTAEQFQYILRDEQQHVRFGLELIKELLKQYPDILNQNTLDLIHSDIQRAVELEDEFIKYVLSKGNVIGYSEAGHRETTRFYVNMRLRSIGLPNFYLDPKPAHQFPWFSEVLELKKEKNFFETRVTEYRAGGALSFDDSNDDQFNSVM